jgi:hypothetical protein
VVEERPPYPFEVAGGKFGGKLMVTHGAGGRSGGVAQGQRALREPRAAMNLIR